MPSDPPLLVEVLPVFAEELRTQLIDQGEWELAGQVSTLRIVGRCRCGDGFCGTFYVLPEPKGAYGPDRRCVQLEPTQGYLILDVVGEKIAAVEVLYRDEIRDAVRKIVG
jgi:hypothetical protein